MNKSPILFLTALAALLIVLQANTAALSQQSSLGAFAEQSNVGNPLRTGRTTYDGDKQEYTIEGAIAVRNKVIFRGLCDANVAEHGRFSHVLIMRTHIAFVSNTDKAGGQ